MPDKLAYSVREAADICGVSRTTLYTFLGSEQLPSVKIGARTLVRRADLEAWLARHTGKAHA